MKMYLARYAHLEKIYVKAGDWLRPHCIFGDDDYPSSVIGKMGNTGKSDGAHLHIDVVEMELDENYVYEKYTQEQIYSGNPKANETQLNYFVDKSLFDADYEITTYFNEKEYYEKYGWHHPANDIISLDYDKWDIYWNRSSGGRVIFAGYDSSYGNHVVVAYCMMEFKQFKNYGNTTTYHEIEEKEEEITNIKIEGKNDLSATWNQEANGYMYRMLYGDKEKSTYGQSDLHDGVIRYIKMHPNNFAIIDSDSVVERTGYSGMNGTFFWHDTNWNLYSTSILKVKEKVLQNNANHLPYSQGVFCYYQDGTFGIEQVKYASELSKPVWWAIGGIEYIRDGKNTYDKDAEGFIGAYSDVHRTANHTSIGITQDGHIILIRHYNSPREDCAVHMKSLGCIYAIGLDGGGSTQYIVPDESQCRLSTRKVANQLIAIDLPL